MHRRRLRRRRAGRPIDHGIPRARRYLPRRSALRGPGPPAPPADDPGRLPGALQRIPLCDRLRRAEQHPRGLPRRSLSRNPAKITDIPVTAGRRLRTIEGTVTQLTADPAVYGEDYLRLVVTQPAYAGMRDDLLEALPNALEIRIHPDHASTGAKAGIATHQPTKTPAQLFSDYCHSVGVSDDRVTALFNHLHDDLTRSTARS
ncbi:exonuclease SbcCD subunit D C-terminal domain-containing protein [Streptacidiphilus monticola]